MVYIFKISINLTFIKVSPPHSQVALRNALVAQAVLGQFIAEKDL